MIDTTGMSLQKVSDAIAGKLINQGGRCVGGGGSCAYGDGKGSHCAVGWLLSESSILMGTDLSISELLEINSFKLEPNREFILNNSEALIDIQSLHDSFVNRSGRCEIINRNYGLNMDAWSKWVEMGES